jgi:hypothetical protein
MAITKWPITLAVIEQRVNSRIKRQAKRFLDRPKLRTIQSTRVV